jgi:hypothetical protein
MIPKNRPIGALSRAVGFCEFTHIVFLCSWPVAFALRSAGRLSQKATILLFASTST